MIKKIEHTAIIVNDLDESVNYYCRMFGFKLRTKGEIHGKRAIAFIFHENDPSYEIELIQDLVYLNDYSENGIVNHLAFTVEDIDAAIKHYKEKGITFKTEAPNKGIDGGKTIFFTGPNGESLQLVQPGDR